MSTDLLRRCAACGIDFLWAIEEQTSSTPPPAFCPMCGRLVPTPERRRGVVKWFNHSKGYGFITPAEGPEVFVHKAGLAAGQALPRAGQLVEFTPRSGARGTQAEEVVVLELKEGAD
jgi:CspA family cold shock protein